MIKFKNKHNRTFIEQYLKEDVVFDVSRLSLDNYESFALFGSKFQQIQGRQRPKVMNELTSEYFIQRTLKQFLLEQKYSSSEVPNQKWSESLQKSFDDLIVDLTRDIIDCYLNENGQIRFNKKSFAEYILKVFDLVINKKDPNTLLVYNKYKGFWEEAALPVNRLIIETAHFVGGDMQDSWNSYLEKTVTDILLRKTKLVKPQKFNLGYFPLENKTLDPKTGGMIEHSPKHLSTFGSSVTYDPSSKCPIFIQFLSEIFNDETTILFVQEWFGYVLSGAHKSNALLIGTGKGANGKSTLFDVLAQLAGIENVSSAPLSNFNSDFGLEPLIGMKLNLATEADTDAFKTGKLKALTAGEAISVNRKNKQEVTLVLPTKLAFLMNELPLLTDTSFGFERRLIILPFEKTFSPQEQDKNLPKKLKDELSGILNWSLEGLERLMQNDFQFTISTVMKESKTAYFGVGDPVRRFVEDCVIQKPSNTLESKEVFHAYCIWMKQKNLPFKGTDSAQLFWRKFKQATDSQLIEFRKSKSNGKTLVRDIFIKN